MAQPVWQVSLDVSPERRDLVTTAGDSLYLVLLFRQRQTDVHPLKIDESLTATFEIPADQCWRDYGADHLWRRGPWRQIVSVKGAAGNESTTLVLPIIPVPSVPEWVRDGRIPYAIRTDLAGIRSTVASGIMTVQGL